MQAAAPSYGLKDPRGHGWHWVEPGCKGWEEGEKDSKQGRPPNDGSQPHSDGYTSPGPTVSTVCRAAGATDELTRRGGILPLRALLACAGHHGTGPCAESARRALIAGKGSQGIAPGARRAAEQREEGVCWHGQVEGQSSRITSTSIVNARSSSSPPPLSTHQLVQASPAARLLNWPGRHWRGAGSQAGLELSTTGHVHVSCQKMRLSVKDTSILPLPAGLL